MVEIKEVVDDEAVGVAAADALRDERSVKARSLTSNQAVAIDLKRKAQDGLHPNQKTQIGLRDAWQTAKENGAVIDLAIADFTASIAQAEGERDLLQPTESAKRASLDRKVDQLTRRKSQKEDEKRTADTTAGNAETAYNANVASN